MIFFATHRSVETSVCRSDKAIRRNGAAFIFSLNALHRGIRSDHFFQEIPMRFPFFTAALLLVSLFFAAPVQADQNAPTPAATAAQTASYSGNVKSKVFHKTGCRYFACKSCTARFTSPEEARSSGYHPCKLCIGTKRNAN